MSMIRMPGAMRAATPWQAATNPSSRPEKSSPGACPSAGRRTTCLVTTPEGVGQRIAPVRPATTMKVSQPRAGPREGGMPMATLSERDMRILAFERSWWRQPGAKEQAISDLLGLSATRYYQLLNDLIDRPEALGFDPVLVKRLRRQRARRNRRRAGGPEAGAAR